MGKLNLKSSLLGFCNSFMKYLIALFLTVVILNAESTKMSIYDFNVKTIDGNEISLSKYRGKVLLIVNVASECGFTPQYKGLQKLYSEYADEGFMVLGFPSNQLGEQEKGSNEKIKFFCQGTYDVTFDMFAKIDVNGVDADPLYKFLKEEQGGFLGIDSIKWNFTKFLVDRDGNIVDRYASITKPQTLSSDIEKLLKK